MSLPYEHHLIARARELRKKATKQENHLWYDFLRNHTMRFQRQKAIDNYIVDFYCHSVKLVIELDGSQHFDEATARYDRNRTALLNGLGITVLRFCNVDIDRNFEGVCEEIDKTLYRLSQKTP